MCLLKEVLGSCEIVHGCRRMGREHKLQFWREMAAHLARVKADTAVELTQYNEVISIAKPFFADTLLQHYLKLKGRNMEWDVWLAEHKSSCAFLFDEADIEALLKVVPNYDQAAPQVNRIRSSCPLGEHLMSGEDIAMGCAANSGPCSSFAAGPFAMSLAAAGLWIHARFMRVGVLVYPRIPLCSGESDETARRIWECPAVTGKRAQWADACAARATTPSREVWDRPAAHQSLQ